MYQSKVLLGMDGMLFLISTLDMFKPQSNKSCWAVIQPFVYINCQFMSSYCRSTTHCSFNRFHSRTPARLEKHSNNNCQSEGSCICFPLLTHPIFPEGHLSRQLCRSVCFSEMDLTCSVLTNLYVCCIFHCNATSLPGHLCIKTSTMNI